MTGGELEGRRPTWAEVDLDALAANYREVRRRVGPQVSVMGVVKADAYGHGAAACARRLAAEGAEWFGVATPEEAAVLRRVGLTQSVLVFGGFWEGQAAWCVAQKVTPVVYRLDEAEALDRAARDAGTVADAHVKIDTGLGRLGVPRADAAEFAARMRAFKHLRVDGLMTHFAAADEPARDRFTREQLQRFEAARELFRAAGHAPRFEHLANSAATFSHPATRGNLVRPGGVLYGLWRDVLPAGTEAPALRPVMALRTRVTLVKRVRRGDTLGYGCTHEATRDMIAATVPAGYADGYARALSNRARVIIRGRYAPVAGRVSMDLTILDVTDVPHVETGDLVTLLGAEGSLSVTAEELARHAGTISYEITCGVSARVPRQRMESGV